MMSFESFVRLGWSFFRTVLRGVFPRRPQLPRFVDQYRPDGILSMTSAEASAQDAAARCYGCGACDVAALGSGDFERFGATGPMGFVVGLSRRAGVDPGSPLGVDAKLAEAMTDACPVRVPFVALVDLVRRRHEEHVQGTGAS